MSLYNFNFHFTLAKYRKNKDGLCPIYLRILLDRKKITLSTNKFILESKWLNNSKRLTTDKDINQHLKSLERKLTNSFNKLIVEDRKVNLKNIKNEFLGINVQDEYSIIKVTETHNIEMKNQIGYKYSKGTLKNYRTTLKYLKEFIPAFYNVKDIPLSELDYKFLKDYEVFLTTKKNCTNNGVMKQVQRLKKIINLSINNGWINKNPFVKFKISYVKTDRGYLTLSELKQIEDINLNPKLEKVRDYFVFSCYTGLAYADIKTLTIQNIESDDQGNEWVVINRKKTKILALIPIMLNAKSLLNKYRDVENYKGSIFPVLSNQKTNDYLKEIAELCGIKKNVSYHLARHTFATTITLSKGVPIETVSKMLGHTKIATTQIYSRVLKSKILEDMGKLK